MSEYQITDHEKRERLAQKRARLRLDLAAQMMAAIVGKTSAFAYDFDTLKERARSAAKGAFIYADALIEEWEGKK